MRDRTLLILLLVVSLAVVSIPMACHTMSTRQAVHSKDSGQADDETPGGTDGQAQESGALKARATPSTARLGTLPVRRGLDKINKKSVEDMKTVDEFKRELGEKP